MKTLVCVEPGLFKYEEVAGPALQKDHALLKIKRVGVCGTDLHAYEGTQPYFNYPRILGHELAAEIIDINNSTDFTIGETVTIIPYFNCGYCIACKNGKPNCCVSIQVCGVHVNGGMVEYLSAPVSSLIHGTGLSLDELALVEPLAIGAHGIRRANVQAGEYVLVIGAGPIGLGTMEFAKIAGASVIGMDVNEQRLFFCKQNLSVDYTINAVTENITERLMEITGGDMPTVIIDATGSLKAINNAFQYLAHGGRYILVGLQKGDIRFSHPEFHKREATLMSSRNATRKDFEHVMQSMKDGLIKPATYITHRVGFSDVKDVFASWLDPANAVIKAMIEL
jgi:2-desacetyl-2-hydroxyethyl bacteriochlorophyllide A dehydrogenase